MTNLPSTLQRVLAEFREKFPMLSDVDGTKRKHGDTYADGYANGHIAGVGLALTEGYRISKTFIESALTESLKEAFADFQTTLEAIRENAHNGNDVYPEILAALQAIEAAKKSYLKQ